MGFNVLSHSVILGSVAAAVSTAPQDEICDLVEMPLHHGIQAQLWATYDSTEPPLLDLSLELLVDPTCVVVSNEHPRVVLVPDGEGLIHVGPNGTQVAVDEADDTGYFASAIYSQRNETCQSPSRQ